MTKQLDKAFNISPTEVVVEETVVEESTVGIQKPSRLTQDDITKDYGNHSYIEYIHQVYGHSSTTPCSSRISLFAR